MSREKQIEEIKDCIDSVYGCDCAYYGVEGMAIAQALYNAGYRRQSEPFSCGHEKGGEWVKLPCKVGDILYVISQMKDKRILPFINEYEVTGYSIRKKSIIVYHEMDGYIKQFKQADFGKTIFLTRQEAEKALAERK